MYDKIETIILLKHNFKFDNKITTQLIPELTLFDESEIRPIGTILKNETDKFFLILYENKIQINGFDFKSLTDYYDRIRICIEIIVQNLKIEDKPSNIISHIYSSLRSGKPLFDKMVRIPQKLTDLGTIKPEAIVFNIANDNLDYMLLFSSKTRGLDYSLRFEQNFDKFGDIFNNFLCSVSTTVENTIIPNLVKASSKRG